MVAGLDRGFLRARPSQVRARILAYLLFEGRPLTTKGRWLNPLVFANLRLAALWPSAARVTAPIFILGTGRSGTTVLGRILALHPQIGFLNEPKALWHASHGQEDIIGSYSDTPGRAALDARDATPSVRRRVFGAYGHYLRLSGAKRIADKYPEMIFRLEFLRALFPDARFVFLTRNGNATCGSIARWSPRHTSGQADWWGRKGRKWTALTQQIAPRDALLRDHLGLLAKLTDHSERAAVEWILTMRQGLAACHQLKGDMFHLPYADLIRSPDESLTALCNFADLDRDDTMLAYARATLRPSGPYPELDLPPILRTAFDAVQHQITGLRPGQW